MANQTSLVDTLRALASVVVESLADAPPKTQARRLNILVDCGRQIAILESEATTEAMADVHKTDVHKPTKAVDTAKVAGAVITSLTAKSDIRAWATKIEAIRNLCDFVENNPDFEWYLTGVSASLYFDKDNLDGFIETAKKLGGKFDKDATEWGDYRLTRNFGNISFDGVAARLVIPRDSVCEKVETGTEEIEVTDPDYEAPAPPKVKQTVTKYEWKCPDSILSKLDK